MNGGFVYLFEREEDNMKNERGQAMVLVVFAIIGMLAIAGLAIDGGRLHAQRRQVQNAADAASLAGTRELLEARGDMCEDDSISLGELDDRVALAVLDYAQKNGVNREDATEIEGWYVDADSNAVKRVGFRELQTEDLAITTGVSVTLSLTDTTTFMKIIGRNEMGASGAATAMFGPVTRMGGGLLPIGFPVQQVEAILDSGTTSFTMFDADGAICSADGVHCPTDPPDEASRGWLNFNYIYHGEINAGGNTSHPLNRVIATNMSNADLMEWGEHGCPHPLFAGTRGGLPPYYIDGDFIAGQPGAREATREVICDTHTGDTVYLPVFDYIYQHGAMQDAFPDGEPSNPLQFPSGQFLYYHIVGFLAADLTSCSGGNKTISGTFKYATIGEGEITPGFGPANGSDPCSIAVYSIVLWE